VISLRHLILHNFWLKFSSIALAMVIWLAIHYSIHNENGLIGPKYIPAPVSIRTAPGDKRVFRIIPKEVVVIAVGEDAAMRRAASSEVRVFVDLTDFTSTESVTRKLHADASPDIYVLHISPPEVQVQQVSP
jgi:hypothetical protein